MFSLLYRESKVMKRILQCGLLNGGIFLLSILVFEYGLLPGINKLFVLIFGENSFMGKLVWSWIEPVLSLIFQTVWVIPLFLLSKVVNALWFQVRHKSVVNFQNCMYKNVIFSEH